MRTHCGVGLGRAFLIASSLLRGSQWGALAAQGDLTVLTMNVAGLPAILQDNDVPGDKKTNARTIGSLLAKYRYDVIHMQEDFNYHAYIYETDNHPQRTPTSGGVPFGSGLNTVANYPWINFDRVKWDECSNASGADCLTPKGFTFMRMVLNGDAVSEAVYVDVYNVHADAGTEDADHKARTSNMRQVAAAIAARSQGNAVIVAGDTNSRYSRSGDVGLREMLQQPQPGLTDAWVQFERNGVVPSDESLCGPLPSPTSSCEIVDKFFYRSSPLVNLRATNLAYVGGKFLQPDGNILTDHNPVLVNFTWSTEGTKLRQSSYWGGPHGDVWYSDAPALASVPSPKASVLRFRGSSRVDSVGVTLSDGTTSFTHGGSGGNESTLTLATNEFWTDAELCQAQKSGKTRIFYIRATTSAGRTLTSGTQSGECRTFSAPQGWQIVGFAGRSGDEIDQLAFLYARR